VLLDLSMPNMGGEESYEEIRKISAGVPVILSSGYGEQESTKHFGERGLAGFIQKPYELSSLRETLRKALGETK
jgi:DNA-binding NtrC family response regulator